VWLDVARGPDWPEGPERARASFEQAARLRAELHQPKTEAWARLGLGRALAELGRAGEARASLEAALATGRASKGLPMIAGAAGALALLEAKAGRGKPAVAAAEEAVAAADGGDSLSERAEARHALGLALAAAGRADAAGEAMGQAAALAAEESARASAGSATTTFVNVGRTRAIFRDAVEVLLRAGKAERGLEVLELSRDANLRRIFEPGGCT